MPRDLDAQLDLVGDGDYRRTVSEIWHYAGAIAALANSRNQTELDDVLRRLHTSLLNISQRVFSIDEKVTANLQAMDVCLDRLRFYAADSEKSDLSWPTWNQGLRDSATGLRRWFEVAPPTS